MIGMCTEADHRDTENQTVNIWAPIYVLYCNWKWWKLALAASRNCRVSSCESRTLVIGRLLWDQEVTGGTYVRGLKQSNSTAWPKSCIKLLWLTSRRTPLVQMRFATIQIFMVTTLLKDPNSIRIYIMIRCNQMVVSGPSFFPRPSVIMSPSFMVVYQ